MTYTLHLEAEPKSEAKYSYHLTTNATDNRDLKEKCGLTYVGDEQGERKYIGTERQWQNYEAVERSFEILQDDHDNCFRNNCPNCIQAREVITSILLK